LPRLGIATWSGEPEPVADDWLLVEALAARDVEVLVAPWDSASTPWGACDAVLIRSCWDYHRRVEEFVQWTLEVEAVGAALWNPAAVVSWNARKTYLRELAEGGLPIVPTLWLEADADAAVRAIETSSWPEVVLKPIVGASSFLTWRGEAEAVVGEGELLEQLLEQGGAMLQPFVPEVQSGGEWSLMYFEGRLSHAVLKRASAGEFRVQEEFGGEALPRTPPLEVQRVCEAALEGAPALPLYARVDGIEAAGGFLLGEVELIEPMLFLGTAAGASDRLADAVVTRLRELAAARRRISRP
jgi:glutathione synthase/RimK-type ligase-like ATP-grasp enzyme